MVTPSSSPPSGVLARLARLLRHRWSDGGLHQALPPEVLERLVTSFVDGAPPAAPLPAEATPLFQRVVRALADSGLAGRRTL